MQMTFIELFAGIGGFRYGLEKCNLYKLTAEKSKQTEFEIQQGRERNFDKGGRLDLLFRSGEQHGYRCVWANEWDKYACQIYRKNFGEGELYEGDITKIKTEEIPDHDLLVGGFPCQAFSIAGKRLGFDDTRGTLFFEIARILADKKPRYFLLENVRGLLSHSNGKTFQTILEVLSDIGYVLQWEVLNSKNYGVPQNRERVFIIGHLRGERRPEVFPIRAYHKENDGFQSEEDRQGAWIPCLNTRYGQRWSGEGYIADKQSSFEKRNKSNSSNIIRRTAYSNDTRIRKLTPIECERLQGFPDNWTEGISDTQRYKCLGNAVTTNVITEIGKRLI